MTLEEYNRRTLIETWKRLGVAESESYQFRRERDELKAEVERLREEVRELEHELIRQDCTCDGCVAHNPPLRARSIQWEKRGVGESLFHGDFTANVHPDNQGRWSLLIGVWSTSEADAKRLAERVLTLVPEAKP